MLSAAPRPYQATPDHPLGVHASIPGWRRAAESRPILGIELAFARQKSYTKGKVHIIVMTSGVARANTTPPRCRAAPTASRPGSQPYIAAAAEARHCRVRPTSASLVRFRRCGSGTGRPFRRRRAARELTPTSPGPAAASAPARPGAMAKAAQSISCKRPRARRRNRAGARIPTECPPPQFMPAARQARPRPGPVGPCTCRARLGPSGPAVVIRGGSARVARAGYMRAS